MTAAAPGRGIALRAEAARQRARSSPRATRSSASQSAVPGIYNEMLAESGLNSSRTRAETPQRPLKRRRTGQRRTEIEEKPRRDAAPASRSRAESTKVQYGIDDDEDDEDIEFEDVALPEPTVQITYRESDEEDEEEEAQFEDVDFEAIRADQDDADDGGRTLALNLTAAQQFLTPSRRNADRKKPINKAEKERRVLIHKMHVLCLVSHLEKRNHWCNDPVAQESLRSLLTSKMVTLLIPGTHLTQFGQTESLKNGVKQALDVFMKRYIITERGMRRALWAEEEKHLEEYQLPDDMETCLEKSDFRKSARTLRGSRDMGAQLFCALLRAAGVETRLVCSLQPLAFVPGGPTLPKPRQTMTPTKPASRSEATRVAETKASSSAVIPSPRARLGHPNAAAYHIPDITAPPSSSSRPLPTATKPIRESPFPVYWVEVLDVAHQKWASIDPLVTNSQWKPQRLEPPASDRENVMSYVVAFETDGTARDVTRRYAKAYNSKTKRSRIDGPTFQASVKDQPLSGERWWRKALKRYRRREPTDLDQIEDNELAAAETREPMPRNVQDFKDHPVYALERHFRRHEVLVPGAQTVGTVGAGSKGPLEKIYRRRDVQIARSADKWYRSFGREIKFGEEPVKILPKRPPRKKPPTFSFDNDEDKEEDDPVLGSSRQTSQGTPIYMFSQTELYKPAPVVNGRVPKNKFGNLDMYVPSMVPEGGVHILDERAAHAAYVLGVDYAPALMGFQFKGRKGTAVLNGVVVPSETEEAVRAVIEGFGDLEAQMEEERRSKKALRAWSRFLKVLKIRQRIWVNADPDDDKDAGSDENQQDADDDDDGGGGGGFVLADESQDATERTVGDDDIGDVSSDVTEEYFMDEDDEGGGFLVE